MKHSDLKVGMKVKRVSKLNEYVLAKSGKIVTVNNIGKHFFNIVESIAEDPVGGDFNAEYFEPVQEIKEEVQVNKERNNMKFLITNPEGVQEVLSVSKKKKRIRLQYGEGYYPNIKGETACVLLSFDTSVKVITEKDTYTFDLDEADYIRKVLNTYHEYLDSPWLSPEERKETIYKLKKGKV